MAKRVVELRDGVELTNLDEPLFQDAQVTKRNLIDYLDAMSDRILPGLEHRPLSVIRIRPGQPGFMQKNLPTYAPDWIERVTVWAAASHREISYALCNDRRTLLWFGNQRAVEYHPTLMRVPENVLSWLILDLDPPEGDIDRSWSKSGTVVRTARLVQQALAEAKLAGAVKTSGAKGLHIFVPLAPGTGFEDAAAATRALAARAAALDPSVATTAYIKDDREGKVFVDSTRAGGATVVAAYSPRVRPQLPVSFPVSWDDLDDIAPTDFTVLTVPQLLGTTDPWSQNMPAPQELSAELIEEGHRIPIARVQAMHEGKRRKRAREAEPPA